MKTINASNVFMFPNQYEDIVILLRSVTTYMLLHQNIRLLSNIELEPLFENKKHISIMSDSKKDTYYLEHLSSFKVEWWKRNTTLWSSTLWKNWVIECIKLLKLYPSIQKVVFQFYRNEIDTCFEKSCHQMKEFKRNYPSFENEMIESWFFMRRVCTEDTSSMLKGHIEALSIIYKQISSSDIKKNIAKDIFSIVELYSGIIEKSLDDPKKCNVTVTDFKKEVNKTINNYVNFVKTDSINFKVWLLSLYQFIISCEFISFDIAKNMMKLNMIFYFSFPVDSIVHYPKVHVNDKQITHDKMIHVHPFMRGMYYKECLN